MQASAPIYTGTGPHIGASQRRRAIIDQWVRDLRLRANVAIPLSPEP